MPREIDIDGIRYVRVQEIWTTPAVLDDPIDVRVRNAPESRSSFVRATQLLPVRPLYQEEPLDTPLRYPRLEGNRCDYALAPLREGYVYVLNVTRNELSENPLSGRGADDLDLLLNQGNFLANASEELFVCYSEVQWTRRKMLQIKNDPVERDAFMHPIRPDNRGQGFDAGVAKVGSLEFSADWFADDAFKQDLQQRYQAHEEEHGMGSARLLIIPDDLGLLRDLSEAQERTLADMNDWLEEDDRQTRYQVGAFVESLTALADNELLELANTPDFKTHLKPLVDQAQRDPSRQAVRMSELANFLNDQPPQPRLLSISEAQAHAHQPAPVILSPYESQAYFVERLNEEQWAIVHLPSDQGEVISLEDWLIEHLPGFDAGFVRRHVLNFLHARSAYQRHHKAMLKGESFGSRGVNDVIDRDDLRQFMADYRAEWPQWQERLSRISHDRVRLICAHAFHRAAWYFDLDDDAQREHAEDAEYLCIRDLARVSEHQELLSQYSEHHPSIILPGVFALPKAQQDELDDIIKTLNSLRLTYADHSDLQQFIGQHLPHITRELANDMQRLIKDQYRTFVARQQQQIAHQMLTAIRQRLATHSVESLFRLPAMVGVELHEALAMERIQLDEATPEQIARYQQDLTELEQKRADLTRQRHNVRLQASLLRQNDTQERRVRLAEEKNAFKATQARLLELEGNILRGLLPVDVGEAQDGRVGTSVRLNDESAHRNLRSLMSQTSVQVSTGAFALANERAFQRSLDYMRLSRWDSLAGALFLVQASNTITAYKDYKAAIQQHGVGDRTPVFQSLAATSATGFSLVQGVGAGLMIARMDTASQTFRVSLGALHLLSGIGTYGLGFVTAISATAQASRNLSEALDRGDYQATVAASINLAANAGLTGVYGTGLGVTLLDGRRALSALASGGMDGLRQALVTSGVRLTTLFVRLNLVGLAFTLIEIAARYWYNHRNLTPLNEWLLQSIWGQQPSNAPLEEQLQQLEVALYRPPSAQIKVAHHTTWVELTIPSLSLAALAEQRDAPTLEVAYSNNSPKNHWMPWTLEFMTRSELTPNTAPNGALTLRYELAPLELNAQHGLVFAVTEPGAPGGRRITHLQSRTLSLAAPPNPLNPFRSAPEYLTSKAFDDVEVPVSVARYSGNAPIELPMLRLLHD